MIYFLNIQVAFYCRIAQSNSIYRSFNNTAWKNGIDAFIIKAVAAKYHSPQVPVAVTGFYLFKNSGDICLLIVECIGNIITYTGTERISFNIVFIPEFFDKFIQLFFIITTVIRRIFSRHQRFGIVLCYYNDRFFNGPADRFN